MKVKPNPYIVSFDDGADGGPEHILFLLKGYSVVLKNKGETLCEGVVKDVVDNVVTISVFCDCCGVVGGKEQTFNIYGDFNEVTYL